MSAAFEAYLKWPTRKKVLAWLLVCIVVGVGYYFAGFRPRIQELRGLEADFDRLGKELQENKAIADNLQRVKEEVRRLDEKLTLALEKLPNKEEIPNLLRTVSDLGRDSGLEFLLFKPAPPIPKNFYAEVPLELQVLGRYHDIATFFDKVGRLPRIVTIQDLDVGGAKATAGGLKLTASCRATTFKFLEAGEKGADVSAGVKKPGPGKGGGT
jgi:type IV pilus assembly protein PilO